MWVVLSGLPMIFVHFLENSRTRIGFLKFLNRWILTTDYGNIQSMASSWSSSCSFSWFMWICFRCESADVRNNQQENVAHWIARRFQNVSLFTGRPSFWITRASCLSSSQDNMTVTRCFSSYIQADREKKSTRRDADYKDRDVVCLCTGANL